LLGPGHAPRPDHSVPCRIRSGAGVGSAN